MELNIKTFNTLVDNNNKSQIKYINEMYEKNFKECKNMIDTLGEKITDIRVENSRYAVELIGKSINLTKEWDKIQKIKEEILKEFNEKIQDFKIVSNNTIDSFSDFKLEFNTIKNKFLVIFFISLFFISPPIFFLNLTSLINSASSKNLFFIVLNSSLKSENESIVLLETILKS